MRKENSSFNLNFLSQPGVQVLHNNDYYGCSELERFACYVVADGLESGNSKRKDASARIAVEAIISAFNESPSIRRGAVVRYLQRAHEALCDEKGNSWYKASVTVVVTDYQKLRYGYAGNSRFNLYRSGRLIEESRDHSLSWEMMEGGQIQKDKIAIHEERNNLDMYCGTLGSFSPTVSKKIKLRNNDIFSIFTRGIWENAHTNDILAAVQSAENDPEEATLYLERLILDKASITRKVDNYTVCFVFVDKVYLDATQGKRRKKIIIFSIIAVIVIAIIVVAVILFNRWRAETIIERDLAFHNAIEYSLVNNYVRAEEKIKIAYDLSKKLRDSYNMNKINNYVLLIDTIISADNLLEAKNYQEALVAYEASLILSRQADNLSQLYIEDRMKRAGDYLRVHDLILLGETYTDIKDWDNARSCYIESRNLASQLYYTEGKKEATEALEKMIRLEELDKKHRMAAEFIELGENAMRNGNYIAAKSYLDQARGLYVELDDKPMIATIDQKLSELEKQTNDTKKEQDQNLDLESRLDRAKNYVDIGDEMMVQKKYNDAKTFYQNACDIYADLGEIDEMLRIQNKAVWAEEMEKEKNIADQLDTAKNFVISGDDMMDEQKYSEAKTYYQIARNIYSGLNEVGEMRRVQNKIDQADRYMFPASTDTTAPE